MSKIGKVVSFEKDSNILSPMTDAQYVQYNNSDITVKIKNTLDNNFREVPCVNVKEGLDALSKMTLPMVVEFNGVEHLPTITYNNNEYIRNYGCDVHKSTDTDISLSYDVYFAWSIGDTNDRTQCIFLIDEPKVGENDIFTILTYDTTTEMVVNPGTITAYTKKHVEYSSSKTYTQIKNAIDSGKVVVVGKYSNELGDELYLNNYAVGTDAVFISGTDIHNSSMIEFKINSNDSVEKYEVKNNNGCNVEYLMNASNYVVDKNGTPSDTSDDRAYINSNETDIVTQILNECKKDEPKFYIDHTSYGFTYRSKININQFEYFQESDINNAMVVLRWLEPLKLNDVEYLRYLTIKLYPKEEKEINGISYNNLNRIELYSINIQNQQ